MPLFCGLLHYGGGWVELRGADMEDFSRKKPKETDGVELC